MKPGIKSEREVVVAAPSSPLFDSVKLWLDQFDKASYEIIGELSANTSADQIERNARQCGAWANAMLRVAEERWASGGK